MLPFIKSPQKHDNRRLDRFSVHSCCSVQLILEDNPQAWFTLLAPFRNVRAVSAWNLGDKNTFAETTTVKRAVLLFLSPFAGVSNHVS
jgi:hypothetical protein